MPDPRCELYFTSPFQLLVSVILSAQMTDKGVNACMKPIYDSGFDIDTVITWGEAAFAQKIKSIGLAPTKSKNILKTAQILKEQHSYKIPRQKADLLKLPGVGPKTANVILAELYHQPLLAVDTHVFRVGKRLGLHRANTPLLAESELLKVIDPCFLPKAHHWLILHGRYTCKAIKPQCSSCHIKEFCTFKSKHI
jgi:endonuclease III